MTAEEAHDLWLRCDFCGDEAPAWVYPCETFTEPHVDSTGAWLACEPCYMLLEAGMWDRLAGRAVEQYTERHVCALLVAWVWVWDLTPIMPVIVRTVDLAHAAFRRHRKDSRPYRFG